MWYILYVDVISDSTSMNHYQEVIKLHNHTITRGKGSDTRWYTYIGSGNERIKISAQSKSDLYEKLYNYYYQDITLLKVYPMWRDYRIATCNRINTVYRNDKDWIKYYLKESCSQSLINKPVERITTADVKLWAHQLIKKYRMTRKQYTNVQTILKKMIQYLIDSEKLEKDPTAYLHLDQMIFRRSSKKESETQIFYHDEVVQIIKRCRELAFQKRDEGYLAIPMFFLTGVRIGEILALGYDDFIKKKSIVKIHRSLCTDYQPVGEGWSKRQFIIEDHLKQNSESRNVLVPSEVFQIVKEVRKIPMSKNGVMPFLFPAKTPNVVSGKLYKICDELGILRRSPHKCRKTYISSLLNKGVDADFVREQAGHKDLQTTLNFYAYSTTRNEKKLAQLNEALKMY